MVLFGGMELLDSVFTFCACAGGLLFTIRAALVLLGSHGHDGSFDHGDTPTDHGDGLDSDQGFTLLTIQGISSFFLLFGLVGLAMHRQSEFGPIVSLLTACVAGLGTMVLIAKIVSAMARLQSDGSFDIKETIGSEGIVYLRIPADGVGKVHVTAQKRLREYNAKSSEGHEIKTGEQITVLWIEEDDVLVVEKRDDILNLT